MRAEAVSHGWGNGAPYFRCPIGFYVAEKIRELQGQRSIIKERLNKIKSHNAIPMHLFREESLDGFQTMIKEMFLGEDRVATKAYLKLFIEKIVINLPRIDITCKSEVLLTALENKTAARSGDILAADINWLPSADSNHGPDG